MNKTGFNIISILSVEISKYIIASFVMAVHDIVQLRRGRGKSTIVSYYSLQLAPPNTISQNAIFFKFKSI